MRIELEIQENEYEKAKNILEDEGFDFNTIVNVLVRRIIKEESMQFLIKRRDEREIAEVNRASLTVDKMTKKLAKRLFENEGYNVSNLYIFASENSSTHIFWANFGRDILPKKWSLILNDKSKKVIHLFNINTRQLNENDFVMRADKPDVVDLQIAYNDPTFTDNRSHISFSRFLVKSIRY